jgi:surface antigen
VLLFLAFVLPSAPAHASYAVLCSGYTDCTRKAYSTFGYASHSGTSYWRMYTGTNCTNYVAYRLVTTNGMPNTRPRSGVGNAQDWGFAMASITDTRPAVGSVAWWGRTGHHVAYVEKVVSSTEILVSESNWSGAFDWRRITKSGSGWPDGFIHFADLKLLNTAKPYISGFVKVGGSLTAAVGTWSPRPSSYSYRWYKDGVAISGATAKTYVPAASLDGHRLSVRVTASRTSYPSTGVTSANKLVAPGTLTATVAPTITGTPRVDQPLKATVGTWSPTGATYAYQWLAAGVPVAGATAASFTPGPGQFGARMTIMISASKAGYSTVRSTSAPTAAVAAGALANTAKPTISGTPRVGTRLTAHPGSWSKPGLAYAYQWLVDGVPVVGATHATYDPVAADYDHTVSVKVTASRPGYITTAASSGVTAKVLRGTLTMQAPPTVIGTPRVGSRLTASTGTWSPAATYTYRWYADGKLIADATASTFTPGHTLRGSTLRVRVTAHRPGYTAAAASSTNTAAVAYGIIRVSSAPRVTGTPRLGSSVTTDAGTYTPVGARLRYQWLRDGAVLSGATGRTHRIVTGDLGKRLSVRVTYEAYGYTTRTVTTAELASAKATSAVKASGTSTTGRVTFSVTVTANGVAAPGGKVTIRYGNDLRQIATVVDGKARVTLTNQKAGVQTYRFDYSGTSTVASSTYTRTATIG